MSRKKRRSGNVRPQLNVIIDSTLRSHTEPSPWRRRTPKWQMGCALTLAVLVCIVLLISLYSKDKVKVMMKALNEPIDNPVTVLQKKTGRP